MQLLLELRLQCLKAFTVSLLGGLEFSDTGVLLCNSTSGVLVASLPLFMLCFIGATTLSLALEEVRELFGFKTVAFEE